jgi:hypothetical protein
MLARLLRFLERCSWRLGLLLALLLGFGRGLLLKGWGLLSALPVCWFMSGGCWWLGGIRGQWFKDFLPAAPGCCSCCVGLFLFCFWRIGCALWLFAYGVGLSLFSCRSICTAPVRGGTYFLCGRKESRQRKRLTPPAYRCSPLAYLRSGPRMIRSPAHSAPVTRHSFNRFALRAPPSGITD